MATAAIDGLFEWLDKLKATNKEYKEKKSALKEEKKLLEESIKQLDELIEREVDINEVVINAVNSTPIEDVIRHASKKGFKPSYGPGKIQVNCIKEFVENDSIDCHICFIRPAKFEPELIEKTVDYATSCLNHGHHICNFSKEEKFEFQKWMLPIRYVQHGPIVQYEDGDGKEQDYDTTDDLDKDFLKTVETALKDKPAERLKEARKFVIASMETTEFFHLNFYLGKDSSLRTYTKDGNVNGIRISYPYGYAKPCQVNYPALKDGEKYPPETECILAKPPDVCQLLISRIDSYDDVLKKSHKKDGYRFVMDGIAEANLETFKD